MAKGFNFKAKPSNPAQGTSEPENSVLNRIGATIKKTAEVAGHVDQIRNAIEGVYKLAGAIWPVLLLLWPK